VLAWEDQVKDPLTSARVNSVLVQVFSGTTGEEENSIFKWDPAAVKYKPDIAYVSATQVVVVYEDRSGTDSKVMMIRLRVSAAGVVSAVDPPQLVALTSTSPRVHGTSGGGFFVTFVKEDGKSYFKLRFSRFYEHLCFLRHLCLRHYRR
jgi:hypothetical protein